MNWRKFTMLAVLVAVPLVGCADLTVPNDNDPDTRRALSNPGDVESLIAGGYRTLFMARNDYSSIAPAVSNLGDGHSTNVANAMQLDIYRIPLEAIQNTTSYADKSFIEYLWYRAYRAAKGAYDGLRQIREEGLVIEDAQGNDQTARAEAMAKLIQGLAHGTLAEAHDRAFILDESLTAEDIGAGLTFERYDAVADFAVTALEEAATIASANTFTVPGSWLGGQGNPDVTNVEIAQLAHAWAALFQASTTRTPAERAAADWASIISHVNASFTADFNHVMDDVTWWNDLAWTVAYPIWGFPDMLTLGMGDVSGGYETWMATAEGDRQAFTMTSPDNRIAADVGDYAGGEYMVHYQDEPLGFWVLCCQKPERGTYNHSYYKFRRDWMTDYLIYWDTPVPGFHYAALQLLKAEGLYRQNDMAGAATIINATRVTNGGLPAAAAGMETTGDPASCVPQEYGGSGACGDLFDALIWEWYLENYASTIGSWAYHARGWGIYADGKAIQFPVPAQELEVLQLPVYTFGGVGGNCSFGGTCDQLAANPISDMGSRSAVTLGSYLNDLDIEVRHQPRGAISRIR